jgi:hypothetical protein
MLVAQPPGHGASTDGPARLASMIHGIAER